MVNILDPIATDDKHRRETDRHFTMLSNDPMFGVLVVHLYTSTEMDDMANAHAADTSAWNLIEASSTTCSGTVTKWDDMPALAIKRMGFGWAMLQLHAFTVAYPRLIPRIIGGIVAPVLA